MFRPRRAMRRAGPHPVFTGGEWRHQKRLLEILTELDELELKSRYGGVTGEGARHDRTKASFVHEVHGLRSGGADRVFDALDVGDYRGDPFVLSGQEVYDWRVLAVCPDDPPARRSGRLTDGPARDQVGDRLLIRMGQSSRPIASADQFTGC